MVKIKNPSIILGENSFFSSELPFLGLFVFTKTFKQQIFHKSLDFRTLEGLNPVKSPLFFTNLSTFGLSSVWIPWNPPFFSQIPPLSDSRVSESREIPLFFTNFSTFVFQISKTLVYKQFLFLIFQKHYFSITFCLSNFPKHWFKSNFCFTFFKNTTLIHHFFTNSLSE